MKQKQLSIRNQSSRVAASSSSALFIRRLRHPTRFIWNSIFCRGWGGWVYCGGIPIADFQTSNEKVKSSSKKRWHNINELIYSIAKSPFSYRWAFSTILSSHPPQNRICKIFFNLRKIDCKNSSLLRSNNAQRSSPRPRPHSVTRQRSLSTHPRTNTHKNRIERKNSDQKFSEAKEKCNLFNK